MFKQRFMKRFLIRILILFNLFNLLKINLSQELDFNKNSIIVLKAEKQGYNLTDSKDEFFVDICDSYSYNKKDITLDYRQHYFFFPQLKNITYEFLYTKRNSTYLCFFEFFTFKNFFTNLAFYFIFPLFLFQISVLSLVFLMSLDKPLYNTPFKKMEVQKKNKDKCFLCKKYNDRKKNFSKLISETTNLEKDNTINKFNETEKGLITPSNNNPNKKENLINDNSTDSNKPFKKTINISISNTTDVVEQNIEESKATAEFDNYISERNKDENEKEKNNELNSIKKNNDNKEDSISFREKSIDNYSFGINTKFGLKFNNNFKDEKVIISSKRNDDNVFKKEDKLKKTEFIYNSINKNINNDIKKSNNNNSNFNPPINAYKKNFDNFEYVREEYFYFGYLLARIKDKRSIFDIYLDLLEQCQIIFKFFFTPFNIYEDIRIQMIYYALKLQLYFLFNCLLLEDYVINNIYDNKNFLIDDIYRSFLACVYTYGVGLVLYYLSNIKKTLIKRRYKLENLRILEQRLNLEIYKVTYTLCMDYLFNKLLIFSFTVVFIFLYSFYICFSFCAVYKYTQIYILKGVLFSVIISLISPFIFCWIPSFLRQTSIYSKDEKLYRFAKLIEYLFIP